jgi:hypothetical protein
MFRRMEVGHEQASRLRALRLMTLLVMPRPVLAQAPSRREANDSYPGFLRVHLAF